ncbi:hypothetical protein EON65_41390 [archaeon]|nr:MAG: hypothetical protein EON65_41390 [archaeon]
MPFPLDEDISSKFESCGGLGAGIVMAHPWTMSRPLNGIARQQCRGFQMDSVTLAMPTTTAWE